MWKLYSTKTNLEEKKTLFCIKPTNALKRNPFDFYEAVSIYLFLFSKLYEIT